MENKSIGVTDHEFIEGFFTIVAGFSMGICVGFLLVQYKIL